MCAKKLICLASFVLVLGLVGSASAAVLYSDSFDRPNSNTLGTNDNALGGIILAPWVEVEGNAAQIRISGNAYSSQGGGINGYIDHKFTSAELGASFTIEFDVMPAAQSNEWFNVQFGPEPASFTTSTDVNSGRVPFGFLFRAQVGFRMWDSAVLVGVNNINLIDNSTNPARVKLEFDSPDGYSDGNTATVRVWINDVPVEDLFGSGGSHDFEWDRHTDGLYISFEGNGSLEKLVDNLVISNALSVTGAVNPSPENEATDVLRETVLSWMPGEFADQHDVFFGTNFNDVNEATTIVDPAGVYKGRQSESTYAPDRLDLGQTYYWRVDEVNAAPDYTVFTGNVWQFTAEPVGYPIENIAVTASSENTAGEGHGNTVNGSGLDDDDLHSSESTAMWLTNMMDPNTAWIQFEFDRSYKLYQMLVWNYNSTVEPAVGFGIKEATIEYSVDGANFSVLGTTHEFAQGPGLPGYAANTAVDLSGVTARYVRITANSNWSPYGLNQFGLSEVRFLYIPVHVREPSPNSGATDVGVDKVLSFRAGREAARHDVYLSTDEQSVIDGTVPVATVTETSYAASLDLASTYYWRIDEVNDAETPTTWQGDIWNLSTQEYIVVEDFESYNDVAAGEDGSNLIYETWIDGYGVATNGSTIGFTVPFEPTMETSAVFDGRQSVPLFYDNTVAPHSEVTANVADLHAVQDWAKNGIKALTLRFYGDPNNSVNDQMYVKINGAKMTYDGDAENLRRMGWQMWYIDLASIGANLINVTDLAIGFERIGAFGGQGMVLLDGMRLYSYDRQLVTPSEPGNMGLVVHWPLDGGAGTTAYDASGNGYDGTFNGNPLWVAGYDSAGALNFDGLSDSVISRFADETWSTYTTALWARADVLGQPVNRSMFSNNGTTDGGFQLCLDGSDNYEYHADVDQVIGAASLDWVHLAVTYDGTTATAYYNGIPAATFTPATDDLTFNKWALGVNRGENNWFDGSIDELRVYNIALTPEEIAWLGGRTAPFDEPF